MAFNRKQSALESAKEAIRNAKDQNQSEVNAQGMRNDYNQKPFTKINFYMMGGCLALIIIGFLLMSVGGSDDPTAFNPEIFSTRRIVVGPALAFLGFLLMAFAIIYTPKGQKNGKDNESI